jgi:hypothetical protein
MVLPQQNYFGKYIVEEMSKKNAGLAQENGFWAQPA